MERMRYNFDSFIDAFNKMMRNGAATPDDLRTIKNELNKFFADSVCKEVLYTDNTDKMFFGIKIVPMIDADDIFDYLVDDQPQRISKYVVEFDSHLLNPVQNLKPAELLAMLLHEVSNLVGDAEPIEEARNVLNAYLAANNDHIKVSQSIHYKEILAYGLKDYLSKARSMFYTSDISDLYAHELTAAYGLNDDLASAYRKISHDNIKLYENTEVSKFITFSWTLSLYKNIRIRRVGSIRTLARAKLLTGSRLEKMEIDNVIKRIRRIDDDVLIESAIDSVRVKVREKMKKARLNNLRTIDSAFYELNMQVRNVEDEDDALWLMRQINSNIAIIEEYRNSSDCDEYEREKWNQVLDKFVELRDRLSKTTVYKNKQYGLFVQYPEIVENRY
jgi:hypothetical protein